MGNTTIYCVRHAQGYHNLSEENHVLPDPSLTPFGEQQCHTLAAEFPYHSRITHLVASPLRRTLYTCLLSFPSEVRSGLKVHALPEIQEVSDMPCDTGSSPEKLAEEFGEKGEIDLTLCYEGWNNKQGRWFAEASKIEARARDARIWLRSLAASAEASNPGKDVDIVVVTHGGFLHYLTEDWHGHAKFMGTGWENTEWRSYDFVDAEGKDENASLVETKESRERRKELPLTEAEQRNLKAVAEETWQERGYQAARAEPTAMS